MDGEWSDWIDHDGRGLPLPVGTPVERKFDRFTDCTAVGGARAARYHASRVHPDEGPHWDSAYAGPLPQVIRYRWRKPRALVRLAGIAARPERTPEPA